MAIGLGFNGFAAYVFLAAAGRALGADDSGQVSVLWASLYLIGTGLFLPLEQELSRSIAARRARGESWGMLVRQVSRFGIVLCGAVALVVLIASPWLADTLFRGDMGFVLALVYGVAGVALSYAVRGFLAGSGRYYGYATFYLVDGATKALPAVVLVAVGIDWPMAFALTVTTSALIGAIAPMSRGARLGEPGSPAPWAPLRRSLGYLLFTALLTSVVLNSGTIAVEVLATAGEADKASVFLSGLVIARVPLFFFQAIQAIVLPRLSHSAASDDMGGFRSLLRLLMVGIAGLTVLAVIVSAAIGPAVVEILFGSDFTLSARDMALLTLASMLMMAAMTVNQAQIALHHQHETGWPWAVGTAVFVAVTATAGPDLLLRVELAMVAAGATSAVLAGVLLARELNHPDEDRERSTTL
jgi:O-antigen/teichoic acid export membrane protein